MKIIIAILLSSTFGFSFPALADTDQEIMVTLNDLAGRITVSLPGQSYVNLGGSLFALGLIVPGIHSFMSPTRLSAIGVSPDSLTRIVKNYAVTTMAVGTSMVLGARIYQLSQRPKMAEQATAYETPEGLAQFFALSLDDQLEIARRDPEFTDYLKKLNQSFNHIERGYKPGENGMSK